jgi:membrane-associated phospholipid phosphatase
MNTWQHLLILSDYWITRTMKVYCIFFVLLLLSVPDSFSQKTLSHTDAYRFVDGAIFTYSRPVHWKQKDWLIFGGVVAATAAVTLIDEPVKDLFAGMDNQFLDAVERVGYHYGKPYSAFTFTGGFYLYGLIFNNRWAKDTGIALGVTMLTTGFLQTTMKYAVGRSRPDVEAGPYTFKPFSSNAGYHAFPSGHFAVAFGISLVLAKRVDNIPLKVFLYSLSATSAISRIYNESHWMSDIVFGGAMSWFFSETIMKRLELTQGKNKKKITWNAHPFPGGLRLTAHFTGN